MQKIICIKTEKKQEMIDITKEVNRVIEGSNIAKGICSIYTQHTTSSIIINENYDSNVCDDILAGLSELFDKKKWKHDAVDNNAAAHIKSAILGCSVSIPIKDKKLQLGKWQQIMLVEFDGPRERSIVVTVA
ncbi:MAG: secondary thiamine-phosphate synthase enzyme YjbQ [Nanoarchaeota archaeon]